MSETKVITGKVRFSYAHVFKPHAMDEGETPKYSVSLIIPKKDKKTIKKIEDACKAALEVGKDKFGGKIPKNLKMPLRDGDEEREDDPNFEGCMFVNANSTTKPGIVDADVEPILDQEEFYSGCYGRASIVFFAYNKAGNKGVACALNNLQKLEDGDRLAGGGSTPEEDFGEDAGGDDMFD